MKKLIMLLAIAFCAFAVCGCSKETKESAGDVFNSLKGFGENVFNDIDKGVNSYTTPGTEDVTSQTDTLSKTISSIAQMPYVSGKDVLSIISGIKSSGMTVIIQRVDEKEARVLGKLITCDACDYVEGINELEPVGGEYLYDFCGMNGIIRSTVGTMASRKFEVCRYDAYCTNVQSYADISADGMFDVLVLTEDGNIVGFYFSEQEVDVSD